jgi:transcriptional regulator with XRE-family HTH domain
MSSSNSKSLIIMIDVKYINRVTWDSELGEQLRTLRGKTSCRKLSDKTSALGRRVSQGYLYQLEKPNRTINRFKSNHLTVSLDIIQMLVKALEVELTDIFTKSISNRNSKSFIIMIDVKYIHRIRWDSELVEHLRALRGKTSYRKLSDKTSALGRRVPHEYIRELEKPNRAINRINSDHLTVSLDIIQVLAKALEVELTDIFTKSAIISQ